MTAPLAASGPSIRSLGKAGSSRNPDAIAPVEPRRTKAAAAKVRRRQRLRQRNIPDTSSNDEASLEHYGKQIVARQCSPPGRGAIILRLPGKKERDGAQAGACADQPIE